jgi:hypothetical protein
VGTELPFSWLGLWNRAEDLRPTEVVLSSFEIPKILKDFSSHQIFRRMHGALNIDKKITNYTVWW